MGSRLPFLPLSAQACAAVEPLPGVGVDQGVGEAPDPCVVGSRGDEDEAYMQFSPRGCGQRAFCN